MKSRIKKVICGLSALAIMASTSAVMPTKYTSEITAYAYTDRSGIAAQREQIINSLIKSKVKSGMTDIEKIHAVLDVIASKQYGSGDPLVDGSGTCLGSSYDGLLCLQKMGYIARIRYAGDNATSDHYDLLVLIENTPYIVDCQAGRGTTQIDKLCNDSLRAQTAPYYYDYVTDGDFIYRVLEDGSLSLYDVIALVDPSKKTGKTWTVPTSVTVDGKTYKVSQLGFGQRLYKDHVGYVYGDECGGWLGGGRLYDTTFTDGPIELYNYWDKIIIPKGITYVNEEAFSKVINNKNVCIEVVYQDKANVTLEHITNSVWISPTCTEEGYWADICACCGEKVGEQRGYGYTSPATGHDYTSKITKQPTCTETGIQTYTCKNCGDTYTVTIPAKGHTFTEKVVAPTTTSKGYTLHTCSVCGYSYKDNYTDKIEEHKHNYTSKITKQPTCTENGIRTFTCSCGDTYTEIIPATGHKYITKVVAPTYTSKGYTLHTCSVCGYSYKDNYTDKLEKPTDSSSVLDSSSYLDSSSVNDNSSYFDNSSTSDDSSSIDSSSYLDDSSSNNDTSSVSHIHKYTSKITKEATCTEKGIRTYTCSCGETYTETIPAKGHTFTEKVVAPTTTSKGYTIHTCSVCGYFYKDNYTDKIEETVNLNDTTMKLVSTKIAYTGKAKMPRLTVTYNGKKLVKGVDYTVSLINSRRVGKAIIRVRGIGKYTGTKRLTYYVVPKKSVINNVTSSVKKLTVTWKKDTLVTGYQLQVATDKKFRNKVKNVIFKKKTTNTYTVKNLTSGNTYYVRVRAYKTVGGVKKYGNYSFKKTITVK